MIRGERPCAVVGDAANLESAPRSFDNPIVIEQDSQAQALPFGNPGTYAVVILVVAGDAKHPMRRLEISQWCDVGA